ncbi:hypothetical protein [Streptomyces sp. Ru73]|nr:hypothetical protein [Streptomyces sp. Ru73]
MRGVPENPLPGDDTAETGHTGGDEYGGYFAPLLPGLRTRAR